MTLPMISTLTFLKRQRSKAVLILAVLYLAPLGSVYAAPQDAVKAGVVDRDLERRPEKASYRKEVPLLVPEEEEGAVKSEEGPKLFVKAFRFKGYEVFSEKKLQKITQPYIGQEHTLSELRGIARLVQNYYRRKGYFLARAFVPPQAIQEEVLEIQISEGRLGKLIIQNNKRYKEKMIRRYFHRLRESKTIKYGYLLSPMLLLNEWPSMKVAASLKKGEVPGTTDVVLDVKEKLPIRCYFNTNNGGSDFVSKQRVGSTLEFDDFLVKGDRSAVGVVGGSPVNNLRFISSSYSIPILHYGTRAEFAYSYSDFQSARELRELGVKGESQVFHTGLRQALLRTKATNADAGVSFDYKRIENFLLNARTSDDELRVLNFEFNIDHVDRFHGRTYFDNTISVGIPAIMGGLRDNDPNASRAGAGGDAIVYRTEMKRVQQFFLNSYIIAKLRTQAASDVLPSSEQMVIGGVDTVRGFSQGEHLGDSGYIVNLELRVPPPFIGHYILPKTSQSIADTFQAALFLDHGAVSRRNIQAGETKENEITGFGPGLRIFLPHDISLSFDWGFPAGGNVPSSGAESEFYFKVNARVL